MNEIAFQFAPSPTSNDDQVRCLIDGRDVLGEIDPTSLGVDPLEFFEQPGWHEDGILLVQRCSCGVVGCSDTQAVVRYDTARVTWTFPTRQGLPEYVFDRAVYDRTVADAAQNRSWESVERAAERLVAEMDFSALEALGLEFDWASGRIRVDALTLSFEGGKEQLLYDIPWDHRTPEDAVAAVRKWLTQIIETGTDPYSVGRTARDAARAIREIRGEL